MKKLTLLFLAVGLAGCADFVDEDGNTSIRQVAQGLRTVGDRIGEMAEAIERDADVEAVPWEELIETVPARVAGAERLDHEGDEATDRNGAGMSIAHARYVVDRDTVFVGVADLGALRSGFGLALRWVAPVFGYDHDGEVEEIEVEGYPAIRIHDDDDEVLIALLVEGRFAVIAGAERQAEERTLREALEDVDYRQLERWVDYGKS